MRGAYPVQEELLIHSGRLSVRLYGINDVPRNYTNFYNNNDIFPPGHIINNWKVKFIEDSRGMSVNNFLYRIDALTRQTLNEKFVLTTYFHSLRWWSKRVVLAIQSTNAKLHGNNIPREIWSVTGWINYWHC